MFPEAPRSWQYTAQGLPGSVAVILELKNGKKQLNGLKIMIPQAP